MNMAWQALQGCQGVLLSGLALRLQLLLLMVLIGDCIDQKARSDNGSDKLPCLQAIESKAGRCFYVAHSYLAASKQMEAHALFARSAQHAQAAIRQHEAS